MNIAICEDEPLERENITNLIKASILPYQLYTFSSGEDLLKTSLNFDIIIMDITMGKLSGVETAAKIRERECKAEIIFVTGSDQYVMQAFDVNAFHYLMKPVGRIKFLSVFQKAVDLCKEKNTMHRLLKENERTTRSIIIKTKTDRTKVFFNDIYCAEVNNRKVILYTKQAEIEYYAKLDDVQKEFGSNFFRCHRAFLIHLKYINKYNTTEITLENDMRIPMSKQRYHEFVKTYLQYMKD